MRIRQTLPGFDGRRLDDLVDFLLYTCLPLLLIDRAELLPAGGRWTLLAALLASAYGFSQADVKTLDGAFVGFPSYWNVVALYLYSLPIEGWPAALIVLGLALLTFVPSRYSYPTQSGTLNRWMLILGIPWAVLILLSVSQPWEPDFPRDLAWTSFVYPAIYMGVAWGMSILRAIRG